MSSAMQLSLFIPGASHRIDDELYPPGCIPRILPDAGILLLCQRTEIFHQK